MVAKAQHSCTEGTGATDDDEMKKFDTSNGDDDQCAREVTEGQHTSFMGYAAGVPQNI